MKENLDKVIDEIYQTYEDNTGINHIDGFNLPSEAEILEIIFNLLDIVFPGFSGNGSFKRKDLKENLKIKINQVSEKLTDQLTRGFKFKCETEDCECSSCEIPKKVNDAVNALLSSIPDLREAMKKDIQAAFDGDPAAKSFEEIVLSYPGIRAITIQRLAHVLYHEDAPLIPRMMTEYAHRITGIDIHPGAHLDHGIFIDHGTGVVVGETARIAEGVSIYQGVTLGALSFPKNACGMIIKGARRHPTIEKNVTIYSGAQILGDIVIGANSIIGGNVWITDALPAGTKVVCEPPKQKIRTKNQNKKVKQKSKTKK